MPNFLNDCKNINEYTPIELYKFDFSTITPRFFSAVSTTAFLTPHRQTNGSNIVMNGQTFTHCAMNIQGISSELGARPSRPTLKINRKVFEALTPVAAIETSWTGLGNLPPFPMRGVKIERFLTLHDYNADSDWTMTSDQSSGTATQKAARHTAVLQSGVLQRYFVNGILDTTGHLLELELTPAIGLEQRTTANRKMPTGLCSLRYRSYMNAAFVYTPIEDGGCPYGQANNQGNQATFTNYFDRTNATTSDASKDYCNKTARACKLRWDPSNNGAPIPFMGQFKAGTPGTKRKDDR